MKETVMDLDIKKSLDNLYKTMVLESYDVEAMTQEEMEQHMEHYDYVVYLCHKLEHWLEVNKIHKVCTYFNLLVHYMKNHDIPFSTLDDVCQIVIIAAKYYVRGVYRVKEVYNL